MTYLAARPLRLRRLRTGSGRSGLKLPRISLGLWNNFGNDRPLDTQRAILRRAFDLGVTHFDLANNYGPPAGSAESNFGAIFAEDFAPVPRRAHHLDQGRLRHVAGPVRGLRLAQVPARVARRQSLKRMGLDYVDIFYSHRPDPETPIEETMGALAHRGARRARRSTSASRTTTPSRPGPPTPRSQAQGMPLLIHQPRYNMFDRHIEARPVPGARRARHGQHRVLPARPGHC